MTNVVSPAVEVEADENGGDFELAGVLAMGRSEDVEGLLGLESEALWGESQPLEIRSDEPNPSLPRHVELAA